MKKKDGKTVRPLLGGMICALAALALLALPAHAAPGSRYTACGGCAPRDLAWGEGEFDQVHLVAAPPGARNLHPSTVSVELLTRALAGLRKGGAEGGARLLDDDAAATLAQGLSKALAKAGPQQDAIFLVTSKIGGGVLGTRLGNSGRAFVDADGLNLIVGEAHVEFIGPYRATRMERPFEFGSRDKTSRLVLSSDSARSRRPDWLVIPLQAAAPAASAPAAAPSFAPAPPVKRDEQYYLAQEIRLKALKRLRDQNLIDEQEYQAKRGEILRDW